MTEGAVLVPQTVFPGDEGRLITPLPDGFSPSGSGALVVTDRSRLPFNEDIIVRRVEIDFQAKRLLVDFVAFRPGAVEIPPVTIEGVEFPLGTIPIASILERDGYSTVLSPPERPLAAPGTFMLVIGGAAACITVVSLAVFLILYGPRQFQWCFETVRSRFLLHKARRAVLKTLAALKAGRAGAKESAALVSKSFKTFLGAFYRKDYASYSAEDFLADGLPGTQAIYHIFSGCDKLRFSSTPVEPDDVKAVAERALSFLKEGAA
jgi:hypothetical protein